ncbi:MAG: DNA-binding protein [Alphaproteobacteria bacterium]|nr:DNA-binding protein [Alphaproteobacteria bacterium]
MTKYLNQKQAAEILGIRIQTLNQWRCSKKQNIPYIKIGRVILYPENQFFNFLNYHGKNMGVDYE